MTRRDVLLEKWAEYWMDGDDDEGPVTEPPNYYFEAGFNAAWDALMAEIRPLVADLSTVVIADQRTIDDLLSGSRVIPDAEKIERSIAAVERLRELVRNENK